MARIYQDNFDTLSIADAVANAQSFSINDAVIPIGELGVVSEYKISLVDSADISDLLSNRPDKIVEDSLSVADEVLEEEHVLGCIISDSLSVADSIEYVSEFKLSLSSTLSISESVIDYGDELDVSWQFVRYSAVCCHAGF